MPIQKQISVLYTTDDDGVIPYLSTCLIVGNGCYELDRLEAEDVPVEKLDKYLDLARYIASELGLRIVVDSEIQKLIDEIKQIEQESAS
jgi:hypothetical protein